MAMEFTRKRDNPNDTFEGNGGLKKSKQEMESFGTGVRSKLKPCLKFFSTSGCSFGDGCHFLHYVPGGYRAVTQMTNLGGNPVPSARNPVGPPPFADGPAPPGKTKLCKKFNTPEGCKFGDKCHFAHGELELGRPGRLSGQFEPLQSGLPAAANFGASATAKISIAASLAGAIIGKGGMNSKQICRITGVRLSIKDHDSDPNQRNIELEGTFDQIKEASSMVRQFIMNVGAVKPALAGSAGSYKTKMCEHYAKGSCTYGERCHFVHGVGDSSNPLA
ncbi:zinc finger CCCH domain-containing protein 31-like [Diospyros lotus]|uniref:zinc finger CCCH domain-containing protein 31-like n=1 Tax=Diospyros lotus TaxID=55363 RepID=UPI00225BFDFD|nr:zinc finger CCCH domain-containing protein 31-like [Diospyros lotus]